MEETDGDLLGKYLKGEVDALGVLVEKYRRPMFGFILNMTRGRDEADEIFQEVWFRAIKNIGKYSEKNFSGWLMRIARNIVIDRIRRKKPDFSLDAETKDGSSACGTIAGKGLEPGEEVTERDVGKRIKKAVATLPADQKEVFLLRVQAGLSFKEIARVQEVSINTALARMHYALRKLRLVLKEDYRQLLT
jgi:RNA polymerase sigma-70 factor, ECF subfamily